MSRTWRWTLMLVLAMIFVVAALGGAQSTTTPTATPVGWADQLVAFFGREGPAVMAATVFGLIFKFMPKFKNLTNEWIPVLAAIVSWLVRVFTPEMAHASFLGDLGHLVAPTAISIVDALLAKAGYEIFLRGPTTFHWQKPLPDPGVRA